MNTIINHESFSSYLTSKISKSTTISLKAIRWSPKNVLSVIRWEYRCCFRFNLLVKLFVLHDCFNFNHNAAADFSFKTFWKYYLKDEVILGYDLSIPPLFILHSPSCEHLVKFQQCIIQIYLNEYCSHLYLPQRESCIAI